MTEDRNMDAIQRKVIVEISTIFSKYELKIDEVMITLCDCMALGIAMTKNKELTEERLQLIGDAIQFYLDLYTHNDTTEH